MGETFWGKFLFAFESILALVLFLLVLYNLYRGSMGHAIFNLLLVIWNMNSLNELIKVKRN